MPMSPFCLIQDAHVFKITNKKCARARRRDWMCAGGAGIAIYFRNVHVNRKHAVRVNPETTAAHAHF